MTRKKVKLTFIANDSARRLSYKKRKKGMLKKVQELSTLCGIETCAIVYSSFDPKPEVWPSDCGVHKVLGKFLSMPETEQTKKMLNQESFIAERIVKGNDQIMKLMKENREKEMSMFMIQCLDGGMVQSDYNMNMADLDDLSSIIEQNLKDVTRRLETLNVNEVTSNQPQKQTPALGIISKAEEMKLLNYGHGFDMNANSIQRQGFMDLFNGNGDNKTIMPPFGDVDLRLQTGFWPNVLP